VMFLAVCVCFLVCAIIFEASPLHMQI
jgi:hypothetical protein